MPSVLIHHKAILHTESLICLAISESGRVPCFGNFPTIRQMIVITLLLKGSESFAEKAGVAFQLGDALGLCLGPVQCAIASIAFAALLPYIDEELCNFRHS